MKRWSGKCLSVCILLLATDAAAAAAAVECDFSMHGDKTCSTCEGKTEEFLRFGTVLEIISGIYNSDRALANHATISGETYLNLLSAVQIRRVLG